MTARIIQIRAHSRRNLRNKKIVSSHKRKISSGPKELKPYGIQSIINIFEEHPNLPLSLSDVSGILKMQRITTLKYINWLESKKIIRIEIRNNKKYWMSNQGYKDLEDIMK